MDTTLHPHRPSRLCALTALVMLASLTGCLQIETTISLQEDGSATITERVCFSKRLLEFRDPEHPELNVAALLEKPHILERMKHMGKGIQLVSHTVREAEAGAREAVSVFKIPQITDLKYASPFFGRGGYEKAHQLVCSIRALDRIRYTGQIPGRMEISFGTAGRSENIPAYNPGSPANRQMARQLKPLFEDMLKDFQIKVVFECYAPIVVSANPYSLLQRGKGTLTHRAHLIDISGENLGGGGRQFIANEEAMADVLQGFINGPHAKGNTGFGETTQLFRFENAGLGIMFQPSKHFFDKYLEGKTVDFGRGVTRKADFKQLGYHPEKNEEETKK